MTRTSVAIAMASALSGGCASMNVGFHADPRANFTASLTYAAP